MTDTQVLYEMCARCWHFIEPNDADPIPGFELAAYNHLDNGEKEHDHDAEPSGIEGTLADWKLARPALFRLYPDGQTGPNSAHFNPADPAGQETAS